MSTFKYGLRPSNKESWNSGVSCLCLFSIVNTNTLQGTADILAEELTRATFAVEKMTNFLDGGVDKTKKRRWIVSQTEGEDFSQRSETGRPEAMKKHIESFIGIHKEFAEKGYVPKDRSEVSWMSINSYAIYMIFFIYMMVLIG
jgi:hypothetical protein